MNLVTERAVLARINRKLASDSKKVCKTRDVGSALHDLGDYHVMEYYVGTVEETHVNLPEYAKDLGVMGGHEQIQWAE